METDSLAKQTSETAEKLKREAEALRENASILFDESDSMKYAVQETEEKLYALLEMTKINDTLKTQASEKVNK